MQPESRREKINWSFCFLSAFWLWALWCCAARRRWRRWWCWRNSCCSALFAFRATFAWHASRRVEPGRQAAEAAKTEPAQPGLFSDAVRWFICAQHKISVSVSMFWPCAGRRVRLLNVEQVSSFVLHKLGNKKSVYAFATCYLCGRATNLTAPAATRKCCTVTELTRGSNHRGQSLLVNSKTPCEQLLLNSVST